MALAHRFAITAIAALILGAGVARAQAPAAAGGFDNRCTAPPAPVAVGNAQWNGAGRDLNNTRYQPEPALRASDVPKLALKWAFGYDPAAIYGQPTVVDGRLFVTSSSGRVYSLDARTGCTYWIFDAAAGADTSIVVGELGRPKLIKQRWSRWRRTNAHIEVIKPPSAVFFGDDAGTVYALNAETGALLWKADLAADAHARVRITGTPAMYQDRLYVPMTSSPPAAPGAGPGCCALEGGVAALDIANGEVVWRSAINPPAADRSLGTPIWAAPTVDPKRGAIYVAAGIADAVLALNLDDGKLRWVRALVPKDEDPPAGARAADGRAAAERIFGNPPILQSLPNGRQLLLAGQKSGVVFCLDPDRGGAVLWQTRVAQGADPGGVEWSPAVDHRNVYVAVAEAEADAAPATRRGGLAAIDLATGAIRWNKPSATSACGANDLDCAHTQAQAVTVMPGVVFSGSIDGHLRAYSTIDGYRVWDFDTARDFRTVNAKPARGSALDHGGPTIVGGMVYVNSGHADGKDGPGNVLLAFSVGGK